MPVWSFNCFWPLVFRLSAIHHSVILSSSAFLRVRLGDLLGNEGDWLIRPALTLFGGSKSAERCGRLRLRRSGIAVYWQLLAKELVIFGAHPIHYLSSRNSSAVGLQPALSAILRRFLQLLLHSSSVNSAAVAPFFFYRFCRCCSIHSCRFSRCCSVHFC